MSMFDVNRATTGLRAKANDLARQPSTKTLLIGAAAVVVIPIVLPLVKPVLKATLKTGVRLYEKGKIAIAETSEIVADLAAEAKAELQAESQQKAELQAASSEAESPAAANQ